MRRVVLGLCSALAVAALVVGAAAQERHRVALVIGNGAYTQARPLATPRYDADDIAAALERLGFEVIKVVDGDRRRMESGIRRFGRLAAAADVALFFYSGHSLQVAGKNYMLPTTAKLVEEQDLDFEAIDMDLPLRMMELSGAPVKIAILDASRDNPLARVLARSIRAAGRSTAVGPGLGEVQGAEGTLIVLATAPGAITADATGRNSPFTAALLKWIVQPGLEIARMLRRVREEVVVRTGNRQVPWVREALLGDFFFAGAAGQPNIAPARLARPPPRPGETFRDCADCPEMVVVPAGSFTMGSPAGEVGRHDDEGPPHIITIARGFALGRYEVTRAEFATFARDTGGDARGCHIYDQKEWKEDASKSWRDPSFQQSERDPVVCVGWDDAQNYLRWLSGRTGHQYRLPTESEWEYAARAGTTTARYWGEDPDRSCRYENVYDRTAKSKNRFDWERHDCKDGFGKTAPVGGFRANGFGLRDMLGNVREWVEDCWNHGYTNAPSGGGAWTTGMCDRRVLRGGSWSSASRLVRAAGRDGFVRGFRIYDGGFRVARTLR